jgi:large subunit ribosomal protein L35
MPKMKTHKAGAKRYKVTASGKILRRKAGRKHLLGHKSTTRKNRLSGMTEVFEGNIEKIKLELPYIKYSR